MDGNRQKTESEKFCMECGQLIHVRAEICPKCGVRQIASGFSSTSAPNGCNRVAAALFAILLGGLGIHKFYLGQVAMGVVYLLLCWTFIPAILGLIEGIIYLTMSNEEFNSRYGGGS